VLRLSLIALVVGAAPSGAVAAGEASAPAKPHSVSGKAVFALDGEVWLVDAFNVRADKVNLGDRRVEDVDLSPDGKLLAFTAVQSSGEHPQLYLGPLPTGPFERVDTGSRGYHRSPRFAGCGNHVDFALSASGGGTHDPTQIRRLTLSDRKVTAVTDSKSCNFAPAGVRPNLVAHIVTHCLKPYSLALTDVATGKTKVVATVSKPSVEVIGSPDSTRAIYTRPAAPGLGFFALDLDRLTSTQLAAVRTDRNQLQPRFVSVDEIVFLNLGKVWSLSTKTGAVTAVMPLPPPPSREGTP
jgi:Tol biopolymer transport system component